MESELIVSEVLEGGIGASAGILRGDVVETYDGVSNLSDLKTIMGLMQTTATRDRVEVGIRRNAERIALVARGGNLGVVLLGTGRVAEVRRDVSTVILGGAGVILGGAVAAGWLFNAAYYNDNTFMGIQLRVLGYEAAGAPTPSQALSYFAYFYLLAAVVCVWRAFWKPAPDNRERAILLPTISLLPAVFFATGFLSRKLMENGWIDRMEMMREKLSVGESFMAGAFRFEQTPHGLGVFNVGDSRSMLDVLGKDAGGTMAFVGVLCLACVVLSVTAAVMSRRDADRLEHKRS